MKNIEDLKDENIQFNKLYELICSKNNFNELNNDIKTKFDNIDNINNEIHTIVDTKSEDFKFIQSICEDKLIDDDKNKIICDLSFSSSDKDLDRLKKDKYNAQRRERRLKNKLKN